MKVGKVCILRQNAQEKGSDSCCWRTTTYGTGIVSGTGNDENDGNRFERH